MVVKEIGAEGCGVEMEQWLRRRLMALVGVVKRNPLTTVVFVLAFAVVATAGGIWLESVLDNDRTCGDILADLDQATRDYSEAEVGSEEELTASEKMDEYSREATVRECFPPGY